MKKKTTALFASSLIVGGLAFGATTLTSQPANANPTTAQREARVRQELGTFAQLAKELKPSVVNISVAKRGSGSGKFPEQFRGMIPEELLPRFRDEETPSSGQGSGVIISSDGQVLTNNHVVEGADEIKVTLADGRKVDATIVGTDEHTDLALLKLQGVSSLPAASLGDSEALEVGDWVMAIGNPFGLEATVTVGVLSGKGRVIGAGPYDDFLQTDTSINPGNSGGPLFNIDGQVVGINTAIIRGGQGIGFSIPINMAREVADQLTRHGKVERGFIGAGIQHLSPALKSALGLAEDLDGALISSVVAEGPAARAGLEASDVVVSVDGRPVKSDRDLLRQVARLEIGRKVPVEVIREGRSKKLQIEVGQRPSENSVARQTAPNQSAPAGPDQIRVGVSVTDPPQGRGGAVVAEVMPNSPAARAGLRRGDQIRAVGQRKVGSAQEFVDTVSGLEKGDIALLIERNGRTSYVLIES